MSLRQHIPSFVSGFMGATVAISLLGGAAYAATGGNFILGKSNSAGATTSLTNPNGTALALNSKSGTAPLKVSSGTVVTNLNADKLDGLSSSSFAKAAPGMRIVETGQDQGFLFDWDGNATDDSVLVWATCPSGTYLVGGGVDNFGDTATQPVLVSRPVGSPSDYAPDVPTNSWLAIVQSTSAQPVAYAVCYKPTGSFTAGIPVK